MGTAILKISKGLLQAKFLPSMTDIGEVHDCGQYIECIVSGSEVPEGAIEVRAVTSITTLFEKAD